MKKVLHGVVKISRNFRFVGDVFESQNAPAHRSNKTLRVMDKVDRNRTDTKNVVNTTVWRVGEETLEKWFVHHSGGNSGMLRVVVGVVQKESSLRLRMRTICIFYE